MNAYQIAHKSAEEIWQDILDRSELRDPFEEIPPSIKCMILEDWGRIIRENFEK